MHPGYRVVLKIGIINAIGKLRGSNKLKANGGYHAREVLRFDIGGHCSIRWRHFGTGRSDSGPGSSSSRYGVSPGVDYTMGRTGPAGHLDRRDRRAAAAIAEICEPGVLYRGAARRIG